MNALKVLVVDDSALMRRTLGQMLEEVHFRVEYARNGAEALDKLVQHEPDVVTLDINMPEMDGLTSLSLMMQVKPTPVVMVSSLTEKGAIATLEAMALGAVDWIAKPGGTISLNLDEVAKELVNKVKAAARARVQAPSARERTVVGPKTDQGRQAKSPLVGQAAQTGAHTEASALHAQVAPTGAAPTGLVLVGVSTGGPRTLEDILPLLPKTFPWPVLLAQHMPANFTQVLARRMDSMCQLRVLEVDRPMPLQAGQIYVAKGGTDMVVARTGAGLQVRPMPEAPGLPWHPSVSRMVESAMNVVDPKQLVGVLLTGMGNDGAAPMAELRRRGGRTVAESQLSAVVYGMPQELVALNGATVELASDRIAGQLCQWLAV